MAPDLRLVASIGQGNLSVTAARRVAEVYGSETLMRLALVLLPGFQVQGRRFKALMSHSAI